MNDATFLLVDSYHGHYCANQLIDRYAENLYVQENASYINASSFCVPALIDMLDDNELFIRVDSDYYRVKWNDGEIIAVHPDAEWCDQCEKYEPPLSDNVTVYRVGEHFLPALINGDYTGLSDEEEKLLDDFVKTETEGLTKYHWNYESEHKSEFSFCEITNLRTNVTELHLVKMGE